MPKNKNKPLPPKAQSEMEAAEARLQKLKDQLEQLYNQMKITKEQMEEIQQMLEENQDKIRSLSSVESEIEKLAPLIEKAQGAMQAMTEEQLTELASYKNPPERIRICLEAIVLILTGKVKSWAEIKKEMVNDFVDRVLEINWKKIKKSVLEKLKKEYLSHEKWDVQKMYNASHAVGPLSEWMTSMYEVEEKRANHNDSEEVKALKVERKKIKTEQEAISQKLKELSNTEDELKSQIYDVNKQKERIVEDNEKGFYDEEEKVSLKEIAVGNETELLDMETQCELYKENQVEIAIGNETEQVDFDIQVNTLNEGKEDIGVGNEVDLLDVDIQCDRIAESKEHIGVATGDDLLPEEEDGFELLERGTQTDHEITLFGMKEDREGHDYVGKISKTGEPEEVDTDDKQVQCHFVDYYTIETQTDNNITLFEYHDEDQFVYIERAYKEISEIEELLRRKTESGFEEKQSQCQFKTFYSTEAQTDYTITGYMSEVVTEGFEFTETFTREYTEEEEEQRRMTYEETETKNVQCRFVTLFTTPSQTDKEITGYHQEFESEGFEFDERHFRIDELESDDANEPANRAKQDSKMVQCHFETLYSTPTQTDAMETEDTNMKSKRGMKKEISLTSYVNKESARLIEQSRVSKPIEESRVSSKMIQCDFAVNYTTETQTDNRITNFDDDLDNPDYQFVERKMELRGYDFSKKRKQRRETELNVVSQRDLLMSNRSIRDIDFNQENANKQTQCHIAIFYGVGNQTDDAITGYLLNENRRGWEYYRTFRMKEEEEREISHFENKAVMCQYIVHYSISCQTDHKITQYNINKNNIPKQYLLRKDNPFESNNAMVQTESQASLVLPSSREQTVKHTNKVDYSVKGDIFGSNLIKADINFNRQRVNTNKQVDLPLKKKEGKSVLISHKQVDLPLKKKEGKSILIASKPVNLKTDIRYNGKWISEEEYKLIKSRRRSNIPLEGLGNKSKHIKSRSDIKETDKSDASIKHVAKQVQMPNIKMAKSLAFDNHSQNQFASSTNQRKVYGSTMNNLYGQQNVKSYTLYKEAEPKRVRKSEIIDVRTKKRSRSIIRVESYNNNPDFIKNKEHLMKQVNTEKRESRQEDNYRSEMQVKKEGEEIKQVYQSTNVRRNTEKRTSVLDTRMDKILLKK